MPPKTISGGNKPNVTGPEPNIAEDNMGANDNKPKPINPEQDSDAEEPILSDVEDLDDQGLLKKIFISGWPHRGFCTKCICILCIKM